MADVLDTLTQGRSILSKLTIPEGLTSLQIVERMRAEPDLVGDITEIPPEGALLPDTYRFSKGMERKELLERMQAEMQRFLAGAWEKRQTDLPIKTPEEAVVFASIVEKETGRADERGRVASVFMNRMRRGMKLQSDPTVIYGIVGGQGTLGPPADAGRSRPEDGAQHLPDRRPAADADLQPGPVRHRGDVEPGHDGRPLFRRRRQRRPRVLRYAQRAQRRRCELAQGRAGDARQEKGRGRAAAAAAVPIPSSSPAAGAASAPSTQLLNAGAAAAAATVPMPVRKPKAIVTPQRRAPSAGAPATRKPAAPCWAGPGPLDFRLAPGCRPSASRRRSWNRL